MLIGSGVEKRVYGVIKIRLVLSVILAIGDDFLIKVREDLTGRIFGNLIVLEQTDDLIERNGKHRPRWKCKCQVCGDDNVIINSQLLKRGTAKQCKSCNGRATAERSRKLYKKYNDYEIQEDYVIMYTSKGEPFFVDLEDFWKVRDICWHMDNKGYIVGNNNGKLVQIHRLVMDIPSDLVVDHIHGEQSRNDNRKDNLRVASVSQNGRNRKRGKNNKSGVVGVYKHKLTNTWKAYICIDNHNIWLGAFDDIDDAIKARKEAEEKYFGEWSYDNSQKNIGDSL